MIRLERVSKRYGNGTVAVADLTLEIGDGELTVLVGPSGCGKTTTLRMINRLMEPTSGRILIAGENVLTQDPVQMRRGIGYVIQQGGLFPHRRVFDNVAVVPRLLGWDGHRVERRVNELLELVGLEPNSYARRFPHELSGGERQRVGVARALGAGRAVLLRNHGILVAGEDISWAVLTALTLERAARIQYIARVLGDPVPIPREVARELSASKYQEEFAEEYWQDWCRMLDD